MKIKTFSFVKSLADIKISIEKMQANGDINKIHFFQQSSIYNPSTGEVYHFATLFYN